MNNIQTENQINFSFWQKCPKCDGQGFVSKPPWIPGDVHEWGSSSSSYQCNLCNGAMVILVNKPPDNNYKLDKEQIQKLKAQE